MVYIWDVGARINHPPVTFECGRGYISLAFSPDGRRLASASNRRKVILWDAQTGKDIHTFSKGLEQDQPGGAFVTFSPDGTRLASTTSGEVKVWDSDTGKDLRTLNFSVKPTLFSFIYVAFCSDRKRLVSASKGMVQEWDIQTGKELRNLNLENKVGSEIQVVVSPDGMRLASHSTSTEGADHSVKVWDTQFGNELLCFHGHYARISDLAFSPDGQFLASASWDKSIKVWDLQARPEPFVLKGHIGISGVSFSPDGKRLASATEDGVIKVWDTQTGQAFLSFRAQKGRLGEIKFSPDGKLLASASWDTTVNVWDAQTGRPVITLSGLPPGARNVAFSPDGSRIAGASGGLDLSGGLIIVWDIKTGQKLVSVKPDSRDVKRTIQDPLTFQPKESTETTFGVTGSVAFSPDGQLIANTYYIEYEHTVLVRNSRTGQELFRLKGHTDIVGRVAFSPDGRRLASCSGDKTIKVWDVQTGQEIMTLKGHNGPVSYVAFSPDGQRLVSNSRFDKMVKLWDTSSGQELLTLKGNGAVAFSPDGRRLASRDDDGNVIIWDATPRPANNLPAGTASTDQKKDP
jgi:WD40 repeat protein